jgi:DNA-binding beta-propeller fold protein YncE
MRNSLLILFLLIFVFSGCKKKTRDDDGIGNDGKRVYYISNEGAFGYGNGSLSLFYPDDKTIENQAFKKVNGRGPGDVVQSVFKSGDRLFLMVNASNKIEVAAVSGLKEIATVGNMALPRYMAAGAGTSLYVSCWGGGGKVMKMDSHTLAVTDSCEAGSGPEKMSIASGRLFVCNSGGFADDSTVTVIDTTDFTPVKTIATPLNPVDLVVRSDGFVWVVCRGKIIYDANWQPVGERKGALVQIDADSLLVKQTVTLPAGVHPSHMEISPDGKTIYLGAGYDSKGIYTFNPETGDISQTPFIQGSYYGFNVEPQTGNLYCLESLSFTSSGRLKVFSPGGKKLFELKTGIGPNGIIF